jgi:hypothetical protein
MAVEYGSIPAMFFCARLSFAADTIFMADVIFRVLFTELMRSFISLSWDIGFQILNFRFKDPDLSKIVFFLLVPPDFLRKIHDYSQNDKQPDASCQQSNIAQLKNHVQEQI